MPRLHVRVKHAPAPLQVPFTATLLASTHTPILQTLERHWASLVQVLKMTSSEGGIGHTPKSHTRAVQAWSELHKPPPLMLYGETQVPRLQTALAQARKVEQAPPFETLYGAQQAPRLHKVEAHCVPLEHDALLGASAGATHTLLAHRFEVHAEFRVQARPPSMLRE